MYTLEPLTSVPVTYIRELDDAQLLSVFLTLRWRVQMHLSQTASDEYSNAYLKPFEISHP
jgi:hypothetical protein